MTIIDRTGGAAQPNATVVIAKGRIVAAGASDAVKSLAGTREVEPAIS
jgi:predicted amidohydrolase YtcJ